MMVDFFEIVSLLVSPLHIPFNILFHVQIPHKLFYFFIFFSRMILLILKMQHSFITSVCCFACMFGLYCQILYNYYLKGT